MATFDSLPAELLRLIICSVSAQTIRDDSYAVLLVNKTFNAIAQPHVLRSIHLDEAGVRRYPPRNPCFAPKEIESRPLQIHDGLRANVRELEVSVDGKQLHPNQPCLQVCHPNAFLRIHSHMDRFTEVDRWRRSLNEHLTPLAADLKTYRKLQKLTVKMRCPAHCTSTWQPWPRDAEAFLQPRVLCDMLDGISLCTQLTSLTIDTADVEISPFAAGRRYEGPGFGHGAIEEVPKLHVCPATSKVLRQLPKLQHFRMRRRDICPSMLSCEGSITTDDSSSSANIETCEQPDIAMPNLETFILDLRLPGIDLCYQSKSCRAVKHCKSWPCRCRSCQSMHQQLEREDAAQPLQVANGSMDVQVMQLLGPVEDPAVTLTRHMRIALGSFVQRSMPHAKNVKIVGFERASRVDQGSNADAATVMIDVLSGKSVPWTAMLGMPADDPF